MKFFFTVLAIRCLCLDAGPAVSLQDPTGQELIFLRLAINVAMAGPFALVENEMVFQNPQDRRMEGRFSFALPMSEGSAAMPSRLAMEISGKLMEGEVVNRSKAQRVYREILHEARDPALLEQSAGNIFTARVFPIEPYAVVRLILSYAITLPLRDLHRRLQIPLAGLPEIHNFTFAASVQQLGFGLSANCSFPSGTNLPMILENGAVTFGTEEMNLLPTSDIYLDVWEPLATTRSYSVGGQLVTSFIITGDLEKNDTLFEPEIWHIYIDTSASTADSFLVRLPVIEAVLGQVPSTTIEVKVFAFDIEVVEIFAAQSVAEFTQLASSVQSTLQQRLPLGATDFQRLLNHVETQVPSSGQEMGVLILSDCIATANERAAQKLGQLLTPVPGRVVEVGVIGSKFDSPLGSAIASAGHGRIVQIPLTSKDLSKVALETWSQLTKPMGQRGELQSKMGSNSWIWPETAFDLHDGDELVVFSGGEGLTLAAPELQLGSVTMTAPNMEAAGPAFSALLSREASRARLELLEATRQLATSAAAAKAVEFELVRLSEQSRVMTPHTALLVLETDEDYVRFGIPQDRLTPILTVTSTGVALTDRPSLPLRPLPTGLTPQELTQITGFSEYNDTNTSQTCEVGQSECQLQADDDVTLQHIGGDPDMAGSSSKAQAFSVTWFLLFFLCCLDSVSSAWTDLQTDAQTLVSQHGSTGPTERRRELAQKYAAALWTQRKGDALRNYCATWVTWDPSNDLAFEYLSKAAQLLGETTLALRAASSIAEVAPRNSEQLLRGAWLTLALDTTESVSWATKLAERSLEEREDNVNTYRALAMAHWKANDFLAAGKTYARALNTKFHERYGDVKKILREEAALLLRSIQDSSPKIFQDLTSSELASVPLTEGKDITLWIALSWLTDANDVDLHVIDPNGEECYYSHRSTALGLRYYGDQRSGLGPEVISLAAKRPGRYRIGAKYFSTGAMGASRGTVLVRQMSGGKPVAEPIIEVFTLPAHYPSTLPIVEITVT